MILKTYGELIPPCTNIEYVQCIKCSKIYQKRPSHCITINTGCNNGYHVEAEKKAQNIFSTVSKVLS